MQEYDMLNMTDEQLHQLDLERLAKMRPIDDDLMRMMFRNNMPLAQKVLRIFTGINDLELIENRTQYDLKHLLGARSICLDVFASDTKGGKYDLEIQRADRGASPKRARYHSSTLDTELLMEIRILTSCPPPTPYSSPRTMFVTAAEHHISLSAEIQLQTSLLETMSISCSSTGHTIIKMMIPS